MNRSYRVGWIALIAAVAACASPPFSGNNDGTGTSWAPLTSGPDVLTQRNDSSRTGQNNSETILTLSNVNSSAFGKLFTLPVDGYVYAQPLYKGNVTIAGTVHNIVFIATNHDSLYAFDADVGTALWHTSFINPPAVIPQPAADTGTTDIIPEVGILSTPVIDPVSGTLYAVSKTKENGTPLFRLHAIDIVNGQEKVANVVLSPSVPGNGAGNVSGTLTLDPAWQQQRPGLTLLNGVVYVAFGSSGDNFQWHGYLAGYRATDLSQVSVWNASPNGTSGGIWMSGEALPYDSSGNLYFSTGNGDFDGNTSYGDSVVKISTSGGLNVADYYAPFNQAQLNAADLDFASAGVVVLPDSVGTASHPHLLAASGKTGTIYLLDRDNLGKYNPSSTNPDGQIVQYIFNALGSTHVNNTASSMGYVENSYSTPAYWHDASGKDHLYWSGINDTIKMFNLVNGLLTAAPVSQSTATFGWPGPSPSISSNGNTNGILWAVERGSSAEILHAYDATNLARELYNSTQASGNRDQMGAGVKFVVPTITNGKVYVGYQTGVAVFGLITQIPQAATPVLSPAGGPYAAAVTVSITSSTPGSTIYYTTDGSLPSTSSTKYTAPFTVGQTATVSAVAVANGFLNSPFATAAYTIGNTPPPTIAFVQGNSVDPQTPQTSLSLTYSAGQKAGDLNVVVVGWNDSTAQVTAVTDTVGNTYVRAVGPTVQTGTATQSIYFAKNIAGAVPAGNSVTVAFSPAAAYPDIRILEYSGIDPNNPLDVTAASMGNSANNSSGPATTTNANDLILGANVTQSTTTGAGPGFTSRIITSPDADIVEDQIVTTAGSYTATAPQTSGAWVMQLVAFKGASAAPPSPPTAPTNLSASAIGATEIDLAWTNTANNQTGVRVERSSDNVTFTEIAVAAAAATGYADKSVSGSTTYYYRVRATNGAGNSPYTATVNAKTPTPPPPPTAPSGLAATPASSIQINLTWTNTSTTQTGVKIERSSDGGTTYTQVALAVASATSFSDGNLFSSTTYFYRVRATSGAGDSPYSNVVSATTLAAPPPTAPTGLTALAASATQINLAWTNTATQTGIAVERSRDNVTFAMITFTASGATGYSDTGLAPSTTYYYRVRAVGGAGDSPYSNTSTTTTTAPQAGVIAFVQANYADPQSPQASVAIPYTSAQKAGDLNVVVVGWNDTTAAVNAVTDTLGNAYVLAVGPQVQTGIATQAIYYAKNIAGAAASANTVTVNFGVAAQFPDIRVLEYSGVDTANPLDGTASAMGTTALSSSGAVTTTNASDLIIGANLVQTVTSGTGAGFTRRLFTSPDGDIADDRIVSLAGSYTATAPVSPAGPWIMQLVAFKAAPGGTTSLSFASDVYPIITTSLNCSGSTGCHSPAHVPSPSGGLDMGTGGAAGAYGRLVNQTSPSGGGAVCDTAPLPSGEKLVVPGNVAISLLYNKLAGATWVNQSAVLCGGPMPPLQDTPLSPLQLATVRNWIEQGAKP